MLFLSPCKDNSKLLIFQEKGMAFGCLARFRSVIWRKIVRLFGAILFGRLAELLKFVPTFLFKGSMLFRKRAYAFGEKVGTNFRRYFYSLSGSVFSIFESSSGVPEQRRASFRLRPDQSRCRPDQVPWRCRTDNRR